MFVLGTVPALAQFDRQKIPATLESRQHVLEENYTRLTPAATAHTPILVILSTLYLKMPPVL